MTTLNNFTLLKDNYFHHAYRNCIWKFDFNHDYDLTPHLLSADYQKLNGMLITKTNSRQEYIFKTDNILDQFINDIDNLILPIVKDLVFEENIKKVFQSRWPITEDQFNSNFFTRTHIFKDTPNFSMGKHLDNQRVVGNFIINIYDNSSTTEFFNYTDPTQAIFSTTGKKNTGIFFLNTPAALHHIKNYDSDRYILSSSILIKTW